MKIKTYAAFVAMILCAASLASAAAPVAAVPLPTPKDLKEMYEAKQYRTCLQQTARVLQLKGDAARPYDPFSLQLLRGECLVQLQDRPTAISAFTAAEKSPDIQQAAAARAMSLLLSKSPGFVYTPKAAADAAPVNIVEADKRKAAMSALFKDEWQATKPAIDQAMAANNLVPIIGALPRLRDLYALEESSTGADQQVHPLLADLGERARMLIDQELDQLDSKISNTEKIADQNVDLGLGNGAWWGNATRRGLTSMDRDNLRGWIDYGTQIQEACNHGLVVAREFGGTGARWEPLIGKAGSVRQHAENVLAAE